MYYHYFLKINAWKTKTLKNEKYHFTTETDEFWKDYELSKEENEKMSETWERWNSFYVFPTEYLGLNSRGTTLVRMFLSPEFPYETVGMLGNMKRVAKNISLVFRTYIYPFPNTTLLYFHIQNEKIKKVVLLDEETKKDSKLMDRYNFLPNKKNKKVLWYKKFCPNVSKFFYVFNFTPTFTHWKPNSEYICLPSHDNSSFSTLKECQEFTRDKIYNQSVYVQNSSEPLHLLSTTSQEPFLLKSKRFSFTVSESILIICFLTFLILSIKMF